MNGTSETESAFGDGSVYLEKLVEGEAAVKEASDILADLKKAG